MADILQVNWRYAVTRPPAPAPAPAPGEEGGDQAAYRLRGGAKKRALEAEDRLGRKRGARGAAARPGHAGKMSKYRRKTANARERMRMGEINVAYDRLKDTIPLPSGGAGSGKQKCDKLTKINLLHIAINYIRTLQEILDGGCDAGIDINPEQLILNPFRHKTRRGSASSPSPQSPEEASSHGEDDTLSSTPPVFQDEDEGDQEQAAVSPDSGIQEDSEEECPDWTQLSCTLDIRSQPASLRENSAVAAKENTCSVSKPRPRKQPPVSVCLAASNNTNFKLHNFVTNSENKVTKCKPVTLTSRSPNIEYGGRKRRAAEPRPSQAKSPHLILSRQEHQSREPLLPSPLTIETDELFNELNSSIDSFDGISDIDFCYDDPFKVF